MKLIFDNIFNNPYMNIVTPSEFLLTLFSGLLVGFIIAIFATYKQQFSNGFILCMSLLPAIICCIIMVVSDNIGTGVAIAGAFSLVRFRSEIGRAKSIVFVFFAMCSGLIIGVGYPALAVVFVFIMGAIYVAYLAVYGGDSRVYLEHKKLVINIPEDLCRDGVFDDIFKKYTSHCDMVSTKETVAGSVYRITYDTVFTEPDKEKQMIDEIRCRNGNLEISVSSLKTFRDTGL